MPPAYLSNIVIPREKLQSTTFPFRLLVCNAIESGCEMYIKSISNVEVCKVIFTAM